MEGAIAEIRFFAGNFAPRGWATCQGQVLSISQNTALFSVLETTYGGDGQTTFSLPDFRSRMPVGQGHGPGLTQIDEGQMAGIPQVSLQTDQLPSHTHPLKINNSNSGMAATAAGSYLNATAESGESIVSSGPALVQANPGAVGFAGGSQPVSIMPPYLGIIVIICLEGVFPSRN